MEPWAERGPGVPDRQAAPALTPSTVKRHLLSGTPSQLPMGTPNKGVCIVYPADELDRFDHFHPETQLEAQGVALRSSVEELLPTSGWVNLRLALELMDILGLPERAGDLQSRSARDAHRAGVESLARHKAFDTDVWVRHLNLWEGSTVQRVADLPLHIPHRPPTWDHSDPRRGMHAPSPNSAPAVGSPPGEADAQGLGREQRPVNDPALEPGAGHRLRPADTARPSPRGSSQ